MSSPVPTGGSPSTPERAQQLLDHDRGVERRLLWKQAVALLLVLAVVIVRARWLG
jgi:hypothetical protein